MSQQKLWDISRIKLDPENPRKKYDQKAITELAVNLQQVGMINAIEITSKGVIVTGERRYRAALAAGFKKVPVKVVDPGKKKLARQLSENVFRESMSPADTAEALLRLQAETGLPMSQIAKKYGRHESWAIKLACFKNFPPWLQQTFRDNKHLKMGDVGVVGAINTGHPKLLKEFVKRRVDKTFADHHVLQAAYALYKKAGNFKEIDRVLENVTVASHQLKKLNELKTPFANQLKKNLDSGQWLITAADDFAHAMKNAREKGIAPLHLRRASQAIINVEREYALLKSNLKQLA